MGSSSLISLSGPSWLLHPPVESDMDNPLFFVGLQYPGVKLSDGSDAFKFSHSRSTRSNSLGVWPSNWVRGDELAEGLSAVSVFGCKPLFKMSEALFLWVFGRYHVAMRLIGLAYPCLTLLEPEIDLNQKMKQR